MLAHRVATLILSGADPKRIMLATFSRRAAAELGRRVERLLARRLAPEAAAAATPAYAGTFHALGARFLREYATRLGLDPQFTIHDREDSADLMNWARHEMGVGDAKQRFPTKATCLAIYSRVVNARGELKATLGRWFPWVAAHEDALRALFASYVEMKQRQNVLDYDDLLLYFAQMLSEPAIAAEIAGALRSSARRRIPGHQRAAGRDRIGDDGLGDAGSPWSATTRRRSIRSAPRRCATSSIFLIASIRPPMWRRSSATTVRAARSLPPPTRQLRLRPSASPRRFGAKGRTGPFPRWSRSLDDAGQARFVTARVLANREAGAALKSQAVLFRASHHSAALELELTRRNVPFVKYGGLKFLDAAHVKDAVALLRFAENPRDRIAGFRVAQLVPGVGPKIAETLVSAAAADDGFATMAALTPPARARAGFPAFAGLMRRLASRAAPWPAEIADAVAWLSPLLETRYDDARVRMGDLEALERIAASFPSRERFLSELALDPPDATSDEAGPPLRDEDYLILSTIHSAKGQEWRFGVRLELRRRLHSFRSRHRIVGGDRGGAAPALCRHDAREGRTRARRSAALLCPRAAKERRPQRLCEPHPLHSARRCLSISSARPGPRRSPRGLRAAADGPRVDLQARMRAMWR